MAEQRMTFDDAIELHVAAYLASVTRLAMKLQDRTHLNADSKDWRDESAIAEYHRRQAFLVKNAMHEAKDALEKSIKTEGRTP